MKKIGILHISDIHINKKSVSEVQRITEKLINDIRKVIKEKEMEINLICFAGDLIDKGFKALEDEMQLNLAEEYFIYPLLNSLGLTKQDFIIVPGNHEVNINKINPMAEKGLASIASLKEINQAIYDINNGYNDRLAYYYDYMYKNYLTDVTTWNLGYSIVRNINGVNVGIVGIDSSWRSTGSGPNERGNMLVGEEQVGILCNNIKESDIKICLMHHPLDWLNELEMSVVEKRLNQFDLVLRGHVHDIDDKQICRQNYKTIYNTSGKLYPIDQYYSGYSLIDVDMNTKKCVIYSREYYKSPRENFDKALRINENGCVEYSLKNYSEELMVEIDLKSHLKEYYGNTTEKHAMLKCVDSNTPDRIKDFYVDPIILDKSDNQIIKDKDNISRIQLEDLTELDDNISIIGKKECGKTTILYKIGMKLADLDYKQIPIYIDMQNLSKGKDKLLYTCQNFIFDHISEESGLKKEHVLNLLTTGRIVCLIDNVNTSDYKQVQEIKKFTETYSSNRFIFAVEENFYQSLEIKDIPSLGVDCKNVYLKYFGKRQIREMVTKWGSEKEGFNADDMTNKIVTYCDNIQFAKSPFNIAIFMTIWDTDKSFIPINEGKVMETYLNIVLDKFSSGDFQRSEYGFDHKQHFLGFLAYKMYEKNKYMLTEEEFNEIVRFYHDEQGAKILKTKFDVIFFEKNILCREGNYIYFTNTSIMEYCLAYHASLNPAFLDTMIKRGNRGNFIDELSFYSGIVKDCSNLLNILNDEITETLIENMDIIEEVENLQINMEFDLNKNNFREAISKDRKSIEEIDEMYDKSISSKGKDPSKISKIETIGESESFMNLMRIYGNTIKNAETLGASKKKLHLDTYILGMNFQLSLLINILSSFLKSKTKEELPEKIKEEYPDLTDEEFDEIKEKLMDIFKISFPIGIQSIIADNVGTPKLEVIIDDMIRSKQEDNKFTKFMLVFLSSDMSSTIRKQFLLDYIKHEESTDILKMVLIKVAYYYYFRYFGVANYIDNDLLELLSEIEIKLMRRKTLLIQSNKDLVKNQIKQKYEANRNKLVI